MAQPPNPRAQLVLARVAAWNRSNPNRPIDPQAELAVAGAEGLSGGIGDGGHAFGPNQVNDAGGVLTGKLAGLNPQQKNAWAWSPQGIDFALSGVAGAAGGQRGEAAVRSIVSNYERPANPTGEIARALSSLDGAGGRQAASPVGQPAAAGASAPQPAVNKQALVQALLGASQSGDYSQFFQQAASGRAQTAAAPPVASALAGTSAAPPQTHGATVGYLEKFANPYGLTVTSTTGGQHAEHSYHYQGRAVDFGGQPQSMAKLAQAALAHPQDFAEVIYTGPGNTGRSILNGKVVPNSSLDKGLYAEHTNHVHLAR